MREEGEKKEKDVGMSRGDFLRMATAGLGAAGFALIGDRQASAQGYALAGNAGGVGRWQTGIAGIDVTQQTAPVLTTNSGITNTENIAAIIAEAPTGATLFFPRGTYDFARNGSNDHAILINKKVNLMGEGWQGSILRLTQDNCHLIKVEMPRGPGEGVDTWGARAGILIADLRIERSAPEPYQLAATLNNYRAGLFLHGCAKGCFERLWFQNWGIAVHVYSTYGDFADGYFNVDNDYQTIHGHFCRIGIKYTNGDMHQSDNRFRTIVFTGDGTYSTDGTGYNAGLWVEDPQAGDIMVTDSMFLRYEEGMHFCMNWWNENKNDGHYNANIWLHSIWVDVYRDYGFYLKNVDLIRMSLCAAAAPMGSGAKGVYMENCKNVTINQGYYSVGRGQYGIFLQGSNPPHESKKSVYNVSIVNNTIMTWTPVGTGIYCAGMQVSTIAGNNITGVDAGIVLDADPFTGPCTRNVVSANCIHSHVAPETTGITVHPGSLNNTILGNVIYLKNPANAIRDFGTNTIIEHNVTT